MHNGSRPEITEAITTSHAALSSQLSSETNVRRAIDHLVPALHGFSMALASATFAWTLPEALALAAHPTPEPAELKKLGLSSASKSRLYAITAQRIAINSALLGSDGPGKLASAPTSLAAGGPIWSLLADRGGKDLPKATAAPISIIDRSIKVHMQALDDLISEDDSSADPYTLSIAVESLVS